MNRILVLYDSQTGNTAKMAKLVADGAMSIPQTKVRIRSVDNVRPRDVAWSMNHLDVGTQKSRLEFALTSLPDKAQVIIEWLCQRGKPLQKMVASIGPQRPGPLSDVDFRLLRLN